VLNIHIVGMSVVGTVPRLCPVVPCITGGFNLRLIIIEEFEGSLSLRYLFIYSVTSINIIRVTVN